MHSCDYRETIGNPQSCDIQLPSSQRHHQLDSRSVPLPSTFCRKAPKMRQPDVPKALLATIRRSQAFEIASFECAPWSETSSQRIQWEDTFKVLDQLRE